jgi:hypothetical protein
MMGGKRSGEPPERGLVEEALQEAERATARLAAAIQAGDAHFLEHLEARRRAVTWLSGIPPASLDPASLQRLHAVKRGGEIVVSLLRRRREQTLLELKGLSQCAPGGYSAPKRSRPQYKNIDV